MGTVISDWWQVLPLAPPLPAVLWLWCAIGWFWLGRWGVDINQFYIEHQIWVRWNYAASTARSVRILCWAVERGLHPLSQLQEGLVPTFDNTALTHIEDKGSIAFEARIELSSVNELASVVHRYLVADGWLFGAQLLFFTLIDRYFKVSDLVQDLLTLSSLWGRCVFDSWA